MSKSSAKLNPDLKKIKQSIDKGDLAKLFHHLMFIQKDKMQDLLESPIDGTPILHYCLRSFGKQDIDPEKLLTQKEIIDLLIYYGANPDQKDQDGESYKDKYINLLYFFIRTNIEDQNPKSLETFKEYLDCFHENDHETLREAVNKKVAIYHVPTHKATRYPLVNYCIAHTLLSEEVSVARSDVPITVITQKSKADALIKHGANPKNEDYKKRNYSEYLEQRYPEFLLKRIKKYITEGDSMGLEHYLQKIVCDNPKIINQILSQQVHSDSNNLPLQHYCLYVNRKSKESLNNIGAELAKVVLLFFYPENDPGLESPLGSYDDYLDRLNERFKPGHEQSSPQISPEEEIVDEEELAISPGTPTFAEGESYYDENSPAPSDISDSESEENPGSEQNLDPERFTPIRFTPINYSHRSLSVGRGLDKLESQRLTTTMSDSQRPESTPLVTSELPKTSPKGVSKSPKALQPVGEQKLNK